MRSIFAGTVATVAAAIASALGVELGAVIAISAATAGVAAVIAEIIMNPKATDRDLAKAFGTGAALALGRAAFAVVAGQIWLKTHGY